ncbi:hypothetical protein BFP76_06235 [Amylibacter kogurei]|uniref:histidine kinase n=1 Tax=Paramylibacter kogurei TaxID=1889778 RepID=A0A2G5K6Z2_9RHOB|nr:ATP-binding protein [Amylibacter kogurei]PIB24773.1 hypothetical protein BFP76_06235 [Amylibacter kogurei]
MTDISLELIWETLPFPAFVVGRDNLIERGNPASEQLAQTSVKQMMGKPLSRYFGKNSIVIETIRQAHEQTSSFTQYGVDVATAERSVLPCNLHVHFLDVDRGKILLIIQPTGVAQKMSQSLGHMTAARSVSAMAATLAHEIRNPLAGIIGASQLLAMNADAEDSKLAEMIGQEAKRIGKLVDRVEHFGDQRPIGRASVNIHDVLDRASASARAGYGAHVTFDKNFDPSLPDAAGDADLLLQVFQNLIKNAVESVDDRGGIIKLRTSYNSGVKFAVSGHKTENLPLQIEVTDNGKGIPDTLIKEIFEPFVSSKVNGTGLGLSLVSKIIGSHGGLIECSSGEGRTTFIVRLPIWKKQKETV